MIGTFLLLYNSMAAPLVIAAGIVGSGVAVYLRSLSARTP